MAKRGANEVGSCLCSLLNQICKSPGQNVTLFADNCPGQNRNRYLFKMLSVAALTIGNITSIELILLEKGHTQNENDSVHSRLENAKKGRTVYHPGQWLTMAEMACKSRPYFVKYLNQDIFMDLKDDIEGIYADLNNNKLRTLMEKGKLFSGPK